jgi:hypothetical protein
MHATNTYVHTYWASCALRLTIILFRSLVRRWLGMLRGNKLQRTDAVLAVYQLGSIYTVCLQHVGNNLAGKLSTRFRAFKCLCMCEYMYMIVYVCSACILAYIRMLVHAHIDTMARDHAGYMMHTHTHTHAHIQYINLSL